MKKNLPMSEKIILKEIFETGKTFQTVARGLSFGVLIKMIRKQLGMSQKILAKRAKIPQSTISRIEIGKIEPGLSILRKISEALSCDLLIIPILREPINIIRQKQARYLAESHIDYLKGTMSLEKQTPDSNMLRELINEEEQMLLQSPKKLWTE